MTKCTDGQMNSEAPLCAGCSKGEQYMRRAEEVHGLALALRELKWSKLTDITKHDLTDSIFLRIRGQHLNGMVEAIEDYIEGDVSHVRSGEYKHFLRSKKRGGDEEEGAAAGGAKRLRL